jgi:hypothetical protein
MKYLKLFEFKINSKYKVGDYLLLNSNIHECPIVKILNVSSNNEYTGQVSYKCQIYDLKLNSLGTEYFTDEYFSRKLTPEEYEDLELTLTALKYNL